MTNNGPVAAALDAYIADAEGGKSVYITEMRKYFDSLTPGSNAVDLTLQLLFPDNLPARSFPLRLPVPTDLSGEHLAILSEYLSAYVYNLLSTYGGRSLVFCRPVDVAGLDNLLDAVIAGFHPEAAKYERQGYGRCLNVAERSADALEGLAPGSTRFRFDKSNLGDCDRDSPEWTEKMSGAVAALKSLPERLAGKHILGMDIGGSDIKVILSIDGRIAAYKEYDWFPARFTRSIQLVDPILMIARWARARAAAEGGEIAAILDDVSPAETPDDRLISVVEEAETALADAGIQPEGLDRIGLCFPDVVVRDKIVGGEVYKTRGIRNNPDIDYETDFRNLTDLNDGLAKYCRAGSDIRVVRIINDGPMAAFTSAVERAYAEDAGVNAGVFAHTLGTELGSGWLDAAASLPELPLEIYNYVIDLGCRPERQYHPDDLRSLNNFNTGIAGTLQKYLSQSGVFRLALKYFPESRPDLFLELYDKGFIRDTDTGDILIVQEPMDMRKPLLEHLMRLPEREGIHGVCADIFRNLGEAQAVTWEETRLLLNPRTEDRILFGRLVKNPVCFRLMQEGASRIAPDLKLIAADDESAWTPLMRQLRDGGRYTVAQFAQAVGAAYFAVL